MRHVLAVALLLAACSGKAAPAQQPQAVEAGEPSPTPIDAAMPVEVVDAPAPVDAGSPPVARPMHPASSLLCKVDAAAQKACHAKPGFEYIADPDQTCSGGVRRSDEDMKRLREANKKQPCVCLDDAEQRRRAHACKIRP